MNNQPIQPIVDSQPIISIDSVDDAAKSMELIDPKLSSQMVTPWNNTKFFNQNWKISKQLCDSELVPQNYRGKQMDCFIVLDIANRLGMSPLTVMQSSQVVRGKFSWTGAACKAMIDACGKYKHSHYVQVGTKGTDSWGYYLCAEENYTGNIINGPTVTVEMAKQEGWFNQNPKWKNMTELMLKYRCSSFFMRTECSAMSMGFLTAEEQEDIQPSNYTTDTQNSRVSKINAIGKGGK